MATAKDGDGGDGGLAAARTEVLVLRDQLSDAVDALKTSELRRDEAETGLAAAQTALHELRHRANTMERESTMALRAAEERIGKVSALEDGLADLLVEVLRRDGSDGEAGMTYEEHRDSLLAQCNRDVLVLMDMFRSTLRVQLAFKEDYEREIEGLMDVAHTKANGKLEALTDESNDLRRRLEIAEGARAIAIRKQREEERAKDVAIGRSKMLVEQAQAETHDLHRELKKAKQRCSELKAELDSNLVRQEAEALRKKVAMLEHRVKDLEHHERTTVARLQTRHETTVASLREQLNRMGQVVAQKEALQERVEDLTAAVADYKRNARIVALESAERRTRRAEELAAKYKSEMEQTAKLARQAKSAAAARAKKIKAMRIEYNKLFHAVQDAQREPALPYQTKEQLHESANKNPYYADYYRKQLVEKDKEIGKLKSRIHRLMSHEIQQRGHIRSFQFERSRSQAELGRVRSELQHMSTTISMLHQDLEDKDDEIDATRRRVEAAEASKKRWAVEPTNESRLRPASATSSRGAAMRSSASMPAHLGREVGGRNPAAGALRVSSTTDLSSARFVTVGAAMGSGSAEAAQAVDDGGARALNYAGEPGRRQQADIRASLRAQAARNTKATAKARRDLEKRKRAERERAATAAAAQAPSVDRDAPVGAAVPETARSLSPPIVDSGAALEDVTVIQNLLDLDEQQKGLRTAGKRTRPSSARRRPLSATSRGSNASTVRIALSHEDLLQSRRTYRPSGDQASIAAKRQRQRPASATVRGGSFPTRERPVGPGAAGTRSGGAKRASGAAQRGSGPRTGRRRPASASRARTAQTAASARKAALDRTRALRG